MACQLSFTVRKNVNRSQKTGLFNSYKQRGFYVITGKADNVK